MAFEFTDTNFKEKVLESKGVVVVDCWAEWCGPCRILGPIIDQLSDDYNGKALIGKLNVDTNSDVPTEFGITSIPAILFFQNGKMIHKIVGVQPKNVLAQKIDSLLF